MEAAPDVLAVHDSAAADRLVPTSGVACKDAMLCEGFEGYAAGARPGGVWSVSVGKGSTLVVDETKAFSGSKAIHITGAANAGADWAAYFTVGKPVLPMPENNVYVREMVFAAPGSTEVGQAHHIEAWGPLASGGMAMYLAGLDNNGNGGLGYYDGTNDCYGGAYYKWAPTGKWACVEYQLDGSKTAAGGTANTMRIWINGRPVDGKPTFQVIGTGLGCNTGKHTWVAPTFKTVSLGWRYKRPLPAHAVEVWIDDVAIDSKPIACP